MILADSESERREALAGLLPYQKGDFKGLYEVMGERPVTIRLLDPPLHEFLPRPRLMLISFQNSLESLRRL